MISNRLSGLIAWRQFSRIARHCSSLQSWMKISIAPSWKTLEETTCFYPDAFPQSASLNQRGSIADDVRKIEEDAACPGYLPRIVANR
jgi:hypothetical protein